MKFCVPVPIMFPKMDFCEALRKIAKMGFEAAETYDWTKLDLDDVRRTCAETGVPLVSFCTTNFELTNPDSRPAWLSGLINSCAAAKRAGARFLITQVGQDTGARRDFQRESIITGLKAAVPILEESGITLMIEPLNTYVDHPGYFLWSSAEAFQIIRAVGHPRVKVVFDIYHQQVMEGNIIPNVTNNLDCIAHLHAAGHPGRHELQFGENDYKVIFDAIDKAGYQGLCGLEYMPLLDPVESLNTFISLYRQ